MENFIKKILRVQNTKIFPHILTNAFIINTSIKAIELKPTIPSPAVI